MLSSTYELTDIKAELRDYRTYGYEDKYFTITAKQFFSKTRKATPKLKKISISISFSSLIKEKKSVKIIKYLFFNKLSGFAILETKTAIPPKEANSKKAKPIIPKNSSQN